MRFLLLLFLSLSFLAHGAENLEERFREANRLYEQGNYPQAAKLYEAIAREGKVSAPLYFNLGNAYYKAGEVGEAVAAYLKANKLAPRDNAIRSNLRLARQQVGESTPAARTLWGRLSLNEWSLLTAALLALFFLLLALKQFRPKIKILWPATIVILLSLVSGIGLAAAAQEALFVKSSVVSVPEAVVRRGPFEESAASFTAREGAELTIVDQQGDWVQVMDSRNRAGWLPRAQLIEI